MVMKKTKTDNKARRAQFLWFWPRMWGRGVVGHLSTDFQSSITDSNNKLSGCKCK